MSLLLAFLGLLVFPKIEGWDTVTHGDDCRPSLSCFLLFWKIMWQTLQHGHCVCVCVCVCVCLSEIPPFSKKKRLCQASNDGVCSLFCATVFALEAFSEKSLHDWRAPSLLSALCSLLHPLRCVADATRPDQGIQTETEQIKEISENLLFFWGALTSN